MIEDLIIIFFGYFVMSGVSIWYRFYRPVFMPFRLFRWLCSFGERKDLRQLPAGVDGLEKMQFSDRKFKNWFEDIVVLGSITNTEFHCFNKRRMVEIDIELATRGVNDAKNDTEL